VVGPLADPNTQALLAEIWRTFRPRTVVAAKITTAAADAPGQDSQRLPRLLEERHRFQGKPTAFVCQGFVCNLPVNTVEGLKQQLG
jgi:uncharacterized protein YyaL (SSP411 family)